MNIWLGWELGGWERERLRNGTNGVGGFVEFSWKFSKEMADSEPLVLHSASLTPPLAVKEKTNWLNKLSNIH